MRDTKNAYPHLREAFSKIYGKKKTAMKMDEEEEKKVNGESLLLEDINDTVNR